jgi:hypothetical protein
MKIIRIQTAALSLLLLCSFSSCLVVTKTDNGKHKGWYKNPHNPHNPLSNNPGNAKSSPGNSGKSSPGNSGKSPAHGNGKGKGGK